MNADNEEIEGFNKNVNILQLKKFKTSNQLF